MKKVAILTYSGASLFELACAIELFSLKRPEFSTWYTCDVISFSSGSLPVTGDISINVQTITQLNAYDMLIIPSWPVEQVVIEDPLKQQIMHFHQLHKPIYSFCSGAFLLAELGLLNNKNATTHWRYAEQFKARFPKVCYQENVLYTLTEHIGCSAGSASAIDLGIEIIRQDFGHQTANHVARRLVMSPHRQGNQSQFVETPVLSVPSLFSKALDWAIEQLAAGFSIEEFANQAGMSRRTFDRKFKRAFELTPNEWLIQQRLAKAKELLETSEHSIERIAELTGFENGTTMRYHFRQVLSISPKAYRQTFQVS